MNSAPSPHHNVATQEADAKLLQQMGKGDRNAFSELYNRFSRPLYATALRILNDSAEAEDVVQEVFLNLWEKALSFKTARGTAFAWAVTLTRNRSIDRLRMKKRRFELLTEKSVDILPGGNDSISETSADDLWLKEKAALVRNAVSTLPPEQKIALELAFFSGFTQQEIAEKLSEPLGTVKARIRRGLMKLRETVSRQL
ncbi:MAG TPA: sigma-70 family RNA polymerase sigma factor [Opitutaceae bacterium]|nr:sigma-70 family RNA polymerase sigma factor [Opitutaceae bacterium]